MCSTCKCLGHDLPTADAAMYVQHRAALKAASPSVAIQPVSQPPSATETMASNPNKPVSTALGSSQRLGQGTNSATECLDSQGPEYSMQHDDLQPLPMHGGLWTQEETAVAYPIDYRQQVKAFSRTSCSLHRAHKPALGDRLTSFVAKVLKEAFVAAITCHFSTNMRVSALKSLMDAQNSTVSNHVMDAQVYRSAPQDD